MMIIKVKTRTGESLLNLTEGATVRDALRALKINDETIIIKVNKELAHPSHTLKNQDVLELVHIIFGG